MPVDLHLRLVDRISIDRSCGADVKQCGQASTFGVRVQQQR
jgi:hypothetical protein